jgi:hypothetical protein
MVKDLGGFVECIDCYEKYKNNSSSNSNNDRNSGKRVVIDKNKSISNANYKQSIPKCKRCFMPAILK